MTTSLTLLPSAIESAVNSDKKTLRSHHSRRQYIANLKKFEQWRNGQPFTKSLIDQYIETLIEKGLADTTINQKLASIRWWVRKIIDKAYDELHPDAADLLARKAARILAIKDIKTETEDESETTPDKGRHIKNSEFVALINACNDGTLAGSRDRALIYAAWVTGFRRDNLGNITMKQIEYLEEIEEDGTITHFAKIILPKQGKRRKTPVGYILGDAFLAMQEWIKARDEACENEADEITHIFCPITKDGKPLLARGLSGESIRKIILKREQIADIEHLTPHDFRSTFIGNLLDNETDLSTAQQLANHASPETTARYDRRPERRRKQAVKNLTIPKVTNNG